LPGSNSSFLEQLMIKSSTVMQHAQRHVLVYAGLKLQQDIQVQPRTVALPAAGFELQRPDGIFDFFFKQRRDVVAGVTVERTVIEQAADVLRDKAIEQCLDKLRVTEQFLVAGIMAHDTPSLGG